MNAVVTQAPVAHAKVEPAAAPRGARPNVLLVQILLWPNAARLALAFQATDCGVHVLCRRGSPVRKLSSINGIAIYHPFFPLRSLQAAIEAATPDLIIPCDDLAVALLLRLLSRLDPATPTGRRIKAVIERSLGRPSSYRRASARSELASIAAQARVLLPRTRSVSTLDELLDWLGRKGFPAVLKINHSWGGRGVSIIKNLCEAERAHHRMTGSRALLRAVGRVIRYRDPEPLLQVSHAWRPMLSVQAYIAGRPANCAVACWEGEVIASIAVEALVTRTPTDHATVIRVIENPQMADTARRIVRQLGVTGFFGFDFVLEESSGQAFLVEINPRATQINHLALGAGRDLPAALRARMSRSPLREAAAVTDCETIALFPQEWRRDPHSGFLQTAYHDVPYDAPELARAQMGIRGFTLARGSVKGNLPSRQRAS